ncbi:hypothetical protein NT2_08_01070 [Caenibius tardaugens NBRC 16725]|uniref:Polyketide cyclase/dehydrase n=1 Tax=Caenibius tardaugens NBRC 16725 TaxID=1219035 RepID=U2YNE3_9SPHN|nr:SRPBCC family protein [Caenibius tardaugens]AZI35126.1 SRPBCC family protein [Caenibius tardaugens NBRC 16725]GAD50320.1 hypothetical protein NT2_08_01070 [Caenibius tardaugens NBRC 16725]
MEDVNVSVVRELNAPVDAVWDVVSDFGNVSWAMPGAKVDVIGEGPGMIRRLHMPDGGSVEEVLETRDATARSFSYTIPGDMPMPVSNFRAWVQLEPVGGNGTRVSWNASAKALPGSSGAEGQAIFEGLYGQLIDSLEAHLATV